MVGRLASGFIVGGQQGAEIELVDEVVEVGGQAVIGYPVVQAGRHEQEGVLVVGAEGLVQHGLLSQAVPHRRRHYRHSLLGRRYFFTARIGRSDSMVQ